MNSYGRLSSLFYEADKPEAPAAAWNFYREILERQRGNRRPVDFRVYEPMCGTGRFLLPLSALGYGVTGSDASEEMLEICRRKLADRDFQVPVYRHFIQEKSYDPDFDAILIPEGSFCLLTEPGTNLQALKVLRDSLKPGGIVIWEVELSKSRPSWDYPWGGRWRDLPEGRRIVISWLSRYNAETRIMSSMNRYELVEGQNLVRTEYEQFNLRFYDPEEIQFLAKEAGFSEITLFEAYGFAPPPPEADTLVLVARK